MSALTILLVAGLGAGVALVLSASSWGSRPRLADRLRPFATSPAPAPRSGPASPAALLGPPAERLGRAVSRLLGQGDQLARRLDRIGAPVDTTAFRLRQLAWATAGMGAGAVVAALVRLDPVPAALALVSAPALGWLLPEHRLAQASERWQARTFLELGVVAEQLGLLISAGYSLGGALTRLAERGDGTCAKDLARVTGRVRQGLSEAAALAEWADRVDVPEVSRLVAVLALERQTSDLGRLVAEEARACRRERHRRTLAELERRSQQVWIPVTVAALVPGALVMAVPFLEALRLLTGG